VGGPAPAAGGRAPGRWLRKALWRLSRHHRRVPASSFRRTRHGALVAPRTRPADDAPTPSPYLASRHDKPPARPHDRVDRGDPPGERTPPPPPPPRPRPASRTPRSFRP